MTISTPFSSEQEADEAYFGTGGTTITGDEDNGTEDTDPETKWGDLQQKTALDFGWVLTYQDQQNGDRRRWFVIRMEDGSLTAINSSGEVYEAAETDALSALPHFPSESDARAAYKKWTSKHGDEETEEDPDEGDWSNWQKIREESPWWVFSRTHSTEDRAQFLAAGTDQGGSEVYLGSEGGVVEEPHIFDSASALNTALEAYFEKDANGEIPEDEKPTGDEPSTEVVRESATRVQSSQSQSEKIVEKLGGKKVALAAIGAAGVLGLATQTDVFEGGN